jgi:hypothetical protein
MQPARGEARCTTTRATARQHRYASPMDGTKKLVQKYGHRLLAVRYRYDAAARRRIKTVELLEEELPWDPTPIPPANSAALRLVRIAYHETELRDRAKAAGARWQPDRKLWCMTHAAVLALGLEARAVE